MHKLALVLFMALAAIPSWASAATVWRCGEGGSSYSDSPCPGGRALTVTDKRSSADEQAARAHVQRLQALGQTMRQQRLDDERLSLQRNAGAASLGSAPAAATEKKISSTSRRKPATAKQSVRPEDDGTGSAAARSSRHGKD